MSFQFARLRAVQRKHGLSDAQMCTVLGGLSVKTYSNMRYRQTWGIGNAAVHLLSFIDDIDAFRTLAVRMLGEDAVRTAAARASRQEAATNA